MIRCLVFLVVVFEIIFVRSTFFVFFLVEEEKISERGEREFFLCVFLAIKTDLIMCLLYEFVRGSLL